MVNYRIALKELAKATRAIMDYEGESQDKMKELCDRHVVAMKKAEEALCR